MKFQVPFLYAAVSLPIFVASKRIQILVGRENNDTTAALFTPQVVEAKISDVVVFNFSIPGNYSAMQSVFAAPCIPAHDFNITLNGFYSGFRDGKSKTDILEYVVDTNETVWFFDWNTCAEGGVGGINVNETSLETVDGFTRNALRLNGTESEGSASSASPSPSATAPAATASATGQSNDADKILVSGLKALAPLFAAALAIV